METMKNVCPCCRDNRENNQILPVIKWIIRLCRKIEAKRDYTAKEYIGISIGIAIVAGISVYSFAIIMAITISALISFGGTFIAASKIGPLGDFVGGFSAPLIGVIAAVLTFISFFMQYRANFITTRQFDKSSLSDDRDRYDRRLETLISQNRRIADNMTIRDLSSEKTFMSLYKELKLSIEFAREKLGGKRANSEIINIGYTLFYIGVGGTSNLLIYDLFGNDKDIENLVFDFQMHQIKWDENIGLMEEGFPCKDGDLYEITYYPFDGHQTRLGHYFRSYFHALKFANANYEGLFKFCDVYEKIKSLRTQTSTYEQILILINSQTVFGKELLDDNFIAGFKLTKNIPTPMIEFLKDYNNPIDDIDQDWYKITQRQMSFSRKRTD